jgi:hypothetical protein
MAFLQTHQRPYAMFVETYRVLSQSRSPRFEFRRLLREALTYLACPDTADSTRGLITTWSIDARDKVRVTPAPWAMRSSAQPSSPAMGAAATPASAFFSASESSSASVPDDPEPVA